MTGEVRSEAAVPVTFEGLFGWLHPAAGMRGVVTARATLAVPDAATGPRSYARVALDADLERETPLGMLATRTIVASVFGASAATQDLAAFGGPAVALRARRLDGRVHVNRSRLLRLRGSRR